MESSQHVVQRNSLVYVSLLALSAASVALLAYAITRENLPSEAMARWPWRLQLLDVPSATTITFGAVGLMLARSQYSYTIRPAIGWYGRVVADAAPDDRLAWACHVVNGGQGSAVVVELAYRVAVAEQGAEPPLERPPAWMNFEEAVLLIESLGLRARTDFSLYFIGTGRPIPPAGKMFVAWFTAGAMREISDIFLKVRISDQLGDRHERIISLLKGANRSPSHPDLPHD